ncbi:MAG: hypothetical protein WBG71_06765 [Leeuwenhoekiella sp.]
MCGLLFYKAVQLFESGPISEIHISRRTSSCSYRNSDGVYATTVHELAHRGHRDLDPGMFSIFESGSCTRKILKESWAEGVENVVTTDRYLGLDPGYQATRRLNNTRPTDLYNSNKQDEIINAGDKEQYTPIVIDLVDNYNQNFRIGTTRPRDNVNGYNLRQIQTSLNNARGPHTWKENLIRDHFNMTEGFVEELFDEYMYDNCN